MIEDKRTFFIGFGLLIAFAIVFIIIFLPVFGGENGLSYLDNLYNSISKGSAYYVPKVKEEIKPFESREINVMLTLENEQMVQNIAKIVQSNGLSAQMKGNELQLSGNFGNLLHAAIDDSDLMYHNDGAAIKQKYGLNERQALFLWWQVFKEMTKALKKQKHFKDADILTLIQNKVIETSFNYYGIEPQKIMDKLGVVILSLLFYVVYTVWYGFAFMFMFEGWGMKLEH